MNNAREQKIENPIKTHHVNLQFHLVDQRLFIEALEELESQDGIAYSGESIDEEISRIVTNLDVLALVRNKPLGWLDVGLERIN